MQAGKPAQHMQIGGQLPVCNQRIVEGPALPPQCCTQGYMSKPVGVLCVELACMLLAASDISKTGDRSEDF